MQTLSVGNYTAQLVWTGMVISLNDVNYYIKVFRN